MIVDDGTIRELNRQYLGHDRSTDVIAFSGEGDLLGEIACSVDTAVRQAHARGVPLINELTLLAVHGFLHLVGHDDLSLPKWRKMKIAEFETVIGLL
jgi:probable rRNA maturation factor